MIHLINSSEKKVGTVREIYSNLLDQGISGVRINLPENINQEVIFLSLNLKCLTPHNIWTLENGKSRRLITKLPVLSPVHSENKLTLQPGENGIALLTQLDNVGRISQNVMTLIIKDFKYFNNLSQAKPYVTIPSQFSRIKTNFNYLSLVDQIYFINLKKRPERKIHIIGQLQKMAIPKNQVTAITAVNLPSNPQIGCALSHMKALSDAAHQGYDSILILEDDFTFRVDRLVFQDRLKSLYQYHPNWDVCLLSSVNYKGNKTKCHCLDQVVKADTTAGYLVRKSAVSLLFNVFLQCTRPRPEFCANQSAIDVAWQTLQPKLNWYIFNPHLGYQTDKFPSDIEYFRCQVY